MKAALISLAAFCVFGVQAVVNVDPNFNPETFTGNWYILALASTDPMLQSLKDVITTPAARISLLDGKLQIETYYLLGGKCEGMKGTYKQTDQPGSYTASDENGKKDLWVLASDDTYAIVYVEWELKGMPPSRSLQLYSKDPKGTKNLEKFKALCRKMGLVDELVIPPFSDQCFKQISG